MSTSEDAGPSTGSNTKQRRPRPNTYTAKACERCRTRKQRCLTESNHEEVAEQCLHSDMKRNCLDSGSLCVFLPRSDRTKRSRYERTESELSSPAAEESEQTSNDARRQNAANPSHNPNPFTTLPPPSMTNADMFLTGNPSNTNEEWTKWTAPSQGQSIVPKPIAVPAVQYDWNTIMSSFASQSGSFPTSATSDPHIQSAQLNLPPPQPQPQPQPQSQPRPPPPSTLAPSRSAELIDAAPIVSPTSETDDHSVFETAKGLAMISLEAAAEPHYVGESSGSLWTTVISKGMHAPRASRSARDTSQRTSRSPSPSRMAVLRSQLATPLSEDLAALVLETVYRHLHSRYPFMDWLAFEVQWRAREELLLAVAQDRIHDKESGVAAFFVLMILAIGAQYCKTQSTAGLLRAYDYYCLAQPYLRWIVQLHNLANVQGLLLLAIYSLRDTRGPSIWYISGVTIRLCIGLGLHRARTPHNVSKYIAEIRKRIFWTCYTLDRMVSLLLGRPPGISDDDIDAELPIVESKSVGTRPMASAVHYIRLKQLESRIQRAVFTIGKRQTMTTGDVYPFLQSIDQWEADIPFEASRDQHWTVPCCSRDWFLLRGVETRLHLLRPLCQEEGEIAQAFLPQLAQVAAQGCELQKRTHLRGAPTSNTQLHSTFMCGLALLYAIFLRPSSLPLKDVFGAIKAASNTLFAYTNLSPTAGPLFEVFENLSAVCIDRMSKASATPPANAAQEWQMASQEAATNLGPDSAVEYADLFRSLGIDLDNEPSVLPEGLWDASVMFPVMD